jgi:hypothetical protein
MSLALAPIPPAPQPVLAKFHRHSRLTVRQRKKWWEIILSFEMKNQYDVFGEDQMPAFRVEEQGAGIGSFLKRVIFGTFRWFTAHVVDLQTQSVLLRIRRPWKFYFHRIFVEGPNGEPIGSIVRRWTFFRRIYSVYDPAGNEIMTLFGPFWRPWTFEFRAPGSDQPLGMIQKRWSGLLKEMFTDADNFGIDMSSVADPTLKSLLFSATVLIDVVHFERAKGG